MIRPAMLITFLLAVSLTLTLFVVKYQVQDLEGELVEYNRTITEDRQALHVLKAEWSYLNQPARLKALAERHLGLGGIETQQIGTAKELLVNIPLRTPDTDGSVMPMTAQIAIEEGFDGRR